MLSNGVAQGRREHRGDVVGADTPAAVYCAYAKMAIEAESMSDDAATL